MFVSRMYAKDKMVVGTPGIIEDTSYEVINMVSIQNLNWSKVIVSIGMLAVGLFVRKSLILHNWHKKILQRT